MENLLFSSLVYRIIGEPEKWQEDSIEKVNALVDQATSFNTEENLLELKIANDIIERINTQDDVLKAFQTFLEESRYGLIILDGNYKHIYHNDKAKSAIKKLLCVNETQKINLALIDKINAAIDKNASNSTNKLLQISLSDTEVDVDNLYLKITHNKKSKNDVEHTFYVLFLPIFDQEKVALHSELKSKYQLSSKEESVVIAIIEGKNIKQVAEQAFVSQNTVKTHLKSIYSKTNTNSQSALIRLFLNHEVQLLESYFDFKMPTFSDNTELDDSPDLFAILANQQMLCYCDFGPKDGRPLIVLHNNYACRFNLPPNYQQICEQHNRRIIIPDRPGYGKSPFVEGYPQNWNTLLSQFVDFLELEKFDLLGNIFGSTFAVHYCQHNDPRLRGVILTSPILINHEKQKKHLGEVLIPASRLIKSSRKITAEVYRLWLKSMSLNVEKHMHHMLSKSLGSKEQALLNDADFMKVIIKNFSEAQQQQSKGNVEDLLFCLKPHGIELESISVPITIWAGDQDKLISIEGIQSIYAPVINKSIHIKHGYGQDIYYSLFSDIIA